MYHIGHLETLFLQQRSLMCLFPESKMSWKGCDVYNFITSVQPDLNSLK